MRKPDDENAVAEPTEAGHAGPESPEPETTASGSTEPDAQQPEPEPEPDGDGAGAGAGEESMTDRTQDDRATRASDGEDRA